MRYRVKDYTIEGQMIILPYEITLEDLRLLTNETQEISLCFSMFKNKALIKKDGIWTEIPNAISISGNIITVTLEACTLQPTDKLTIEIDKGDSIEKLAKQGENQEATNTAIYNETHNVAQHFGITTATEFTPMTIEDIESELITIWNNTFGE